MSAPHTRPTARQTALQALLRVEAGGYSQLVLDHALRQTGLSGTDAALATGLVYGVLERQLTLDALLAPFSRTPLPDLTPAARAALRLAVYQIEYMDKIPPSAAVNEAVECVKHSREGRAAGYVNGVLRAYLRAPDRRAVLQVGEERQRLSLETAAPLWLVDHLTGAYGPTLAADTLRASLGRPPLHLRVNTCRTDAAALAAALADQGITAAPSSLCPDALTLDKGTGALDRLPAFAQGLFHVQDLASQLACQALDPRPGDRLLDCCAAPGGKSFTLAERMQDRGEVIALDLYEARVGLIRQGAARLGLTCLKAQAADAAAEQPEIGSFDKILCDVPCSGLGILRRKPEIRYKNVTLLDNFPEMQYRILCRNAARLRPGGRLVYATCTLNPAENEAVIARFLREHGEFAPAQILPRLTRRPGEGGGSVTLFPSVHQTDGFFIAAVTRRVSV